MPQELNSLANEMRDCQKCRLHLNRINVVPGEGNPHSEIVFVGEAPGAQENKLGRPFVGAAGEFLDNLLKMVGWNRQDVYITNIVKDQPPGNRDPMPDEIEICTSTWLKHQIKIIDPKVIVTLGRHAMNYFLPNMGSISQIHGRAFRKRNGKVYFPLFHPAVALYRPDMEKILKTDFKKLPKLLRQLDNLT
ncbi:MAG: uracil-DNA glycosylase [bacterium]|nr:uracil-DNA glycosylase [bacterium]